MNIIVENPIRLLTTPGLLRQPPSPLTPKNRGEKRGAGGKDIFTDSTKRQCRRTSSDNYGPYAMTPQQITDDIEYLITKFPNSGVDRKMVNTYLELLNVAELETCFDNARGKTKEIERENKREHAEQKQIRQSATNQSLNLALVLLGNSHLVTNKTIGISLHDSSSIEIWRELQRSNLGWTCVEGDFKYSWIYLLPGASKMEGVDGIDKFSSVDNLVNTLKQRHEESCKLIQDIGKDSSSSSSMVAAGDAAAYLATTGIDPNNLARDVGRLLDRHGVENEVIQSTLDDISHVMRMSQLDRETPRIQATRAAELVLDQTMAKASVEAGVRRESLDDKWMMECHREVQYDVSDENLLGPYQPSDEERLLQQHIAAFKRHKIEAKHVCSVCQEVMSWNSVRVPALLYCGHVETCLACYLTWNEGKFVKVCPICKWTTTMSPIRVALGYIGLDESQFSLVVMCLKNQTTKQKIPIIISCTIRSTGEEIKKSAIIQMALENVKTSLDKTITYPEEFQSLTFCTHKTTFRLHGNTTLYDIGFQKTSHTLYIQEDQLPINHKFIQEKIQKREEPPNGEYQIRLRAPKGVGISDISVTVQKDHTVTSLVSRLNQYLVGKYHRIVAGKKIHIDFPKIGVLANEFLTLKQLKIHPSSYVVFIIYD